MSRDDAPAPDRDHWRIERLRQIAHFLNVDVETFTGGAAGNLGASAELLELWVRIDPDDRGKALAMARTLDEM